MSKIKPEEILICDVCGRADLMVSHNGKIDTGGVQSFPDGDFHSLCRERKLVLDEEGRLHATRQANMLVDSFTGTKFEPTAFSRELKREGETLHFANEITLKQFLEAERMQPYFKAQIERQAIEKKKQEILERMARDELAASGQ